MGASFFSLLFSMCTFILPNATGRVVTMVLAVGFALVGLLRPSSPKMGIRVLGWVAAAAAAGAVVVALVDLLNAGAPVSPPVGP
jgi:hypothetical protein